MGVFNRVYAGLATEAGSSIQLTIDATHPKAHHTAASLLKKGAQAMLSLPDVSGASGTA
jgi:hypothetical protein